MAHEPFTHDAADFVPLPTPSGVEVSDVEARYADLFAEVIWDGLITAEKRQQLRTAAEIFGVAGERARQIEQSLLAAHEARHRFAVLEQGAQDGCDEPTARQSIAPLSQTAAARSPAGEALQTRLDEALRDRARLQGEVERLRHDNQRLEQLADQLRHALSATSADLEQARVRAAEPGDAEQSAVRPAPAGSTKRQGPVPQARPIHSRRSLSAPPPAPAPAVLKRRDRGDPAELHRLLRETPRDSELLRALFRALERSDDADRRWCIAHALVYLGAANDDERAVCAEQSSQALVRPSRAVNEDEWIELLFHPDQDRLVGEILAEIAPAVLLGHMTAMRASLAPEVIDPAFQVDPALSGEPAVRCLSWAAAALGTKLPPVCVCRDLDVAADIVLNPKPTTRLGRQAVSGRSTRELAFLAGEHLSWYRKEHLLGRPGGSVRRLEDMFLAALAIGNSGLPMAPEVKQRVEPIAATIRPLLGEAAIVRVQRCFTRFVDQGGRANLVRWLACAERTAACAGLLLANDLAVAEAMLPLCGRDPAKLMDELIVFFTAGRCSLLRKRIGIAVS